VYDHNSVIFVAIACLLGDPASKWNGGVESETTRGQKNGEIHGENS
jgi:hypothetical protein